jgi:hypothetical protein
MRCKISKSKTNPYIISAIAIFFAVYISGFLYYYCFSAYPAAVYAQQQPKRPTAAVNSTSQEPEPQIAVPSISTRDLNNTSDIQSSEFDDKYIEELFEAEPEDNTETGSENIDNEKMDEKQGTKNLEETGDNKQADRDQQQQQQQKRQASDESASTGSIAEEEEDSIEKPQKGEKQEQADSKEEKEEEKKPDKTGDKDSTDSDKGGEEQKIEDRDEMKEVEEEEIEEGEEEEIEEGEEEEPKDTPSDDTPMELPFP